MFDDDFEEEDLLEEIREEKATLKSVLNKKKLSKWEMDAAMSDEMV
jgi:hypothetical protein